MIKACVQCGKRIGALSKPVDDFYCSASCKELADFEAERAKRQVVATQAANAKVAAAPTPAAGPKPAESTAPCPKCAAPLPAGTSFCDQCGTKVGSSRWYLKEPGQGPMGPVTSDFIKSAVINRDIGPDTPISKDGKAHWVAVSKVPEFAPILAGNPDDPTAGTSLPSEADDDPFAALTTLTPEEQFRSAVRAELLDRMFTEEKRGRLQQRQQELGLDAATVKKIVGEEKAALGKSQRKPSSRAAGQAQLPTARSHTTAAAAPRTVPALVEVRSAPPRPTAEDEVDQSISKPRSRTKVAVVIGAVVVFAGVAGLFAAGVLPGGPATPKEICEKLKAEKVTNICGSGVLNREGLTDAVQFSIGYASDPNVAVVDVARFRSREAAEKYQKDVDEFVKIANEDTKERYAASPNPVLTRTTVFRSRSGTTVAVVTFGTDDDSSKIADKIGAVGELVRAAP